MNICIIGGGNIGTTMAAYFSQTHHDVILYSSKHEAFGKKIEMIDRESEEVFVTEISATNDLRYAISNADIICITYPSFMLKATFEKISPLLKKGAIVGIVPGTGGAEFYKDIINEHTLFGFDRVPCISRIKEYGKSVYHSKKKSVRVAAIPKEQTEFICDILGKALRLECLPLKNYLTVTFTPSNPILHTARTYTMFQTYEEGILYERNFLFYREWNNQASKVLLGMDNEILQICNGLANIDLSGLIPLTIHYESETIEELTRKITGIASLANITSPMKEVQGGFIPDFESRYFIEDIPYGLTILKGFAQIAGIKTPYMDAVLRWHEEKLGEKYIDDNGNILLNNNAITPQKFGINTVEDVYNFY